MGSGQNKKGGMRSQVFAKFLHWLERSDLNLLKFKLTYDAILVTIWFIVMMVRTSAVYETLCPTAWSKQRCNGFKSEGYFPVITIFFSTLIILVLAYFHMRDRYRHMPHRAVQFFHIGMLLHMYLMVIFLLSIVSVNAWTVIAFWALGFLQDIIVFIRVHSAARMSSVHFFDL
eukprot:c8941_g1_i1.p1 GENE.c8941_g1_i1~~c8941_g1_i1.p1  ORF type:complete len:173 (+),score=25.86 c8941_g1_i1:1-519(+)